MLVDFFNTCCSRLMDGILYPVHSLHPIWAILVASILCALLIVWLVGKTSNQRRIRNLKSRLRGHLLEIWLFRDSNRAVFTAQRRTLWSALQLTTCLLPSLAVLTVPMALVMVQLHARYGYQPIRAGEPAILKVFFARGTPADQVDANLTVPDGLALQSPSLRVPDENEVEFQIGARREGRYQITIRSQGQTVAKSLEVGSPAGPLSPVRAADFWSRVLYPVEPGIPDGPISQVAFAYPERQLTFGNVKLMWLWPFLVLSILAVFPIKRLLHVEL